MKGEDRQSIRNVNQEWDEEIDDSPVIYKNMDASEQDKANPKETISNMSQINQSHTIEKEHKLKMIVRSQYWGRELKGRTCRNVYTKMNVKAPLIITSQVVLYSTDGFWGCCPNAGKRVLELQEYHFSDAFEDVNWDLYLVGTWLSPGQSFHDFFLLPQNQTSVDIERNGWSLCGTCKAGEIRNGIDHMLSDLLLENNAYRHRYHHVHMDIMMDKVFDRETPRSRKVNNEKARVERKKSNTEIAPDTCERQESSVATEATASTEHESPPPATSKTSSANKTFASKVVGAAPPIPRFIPNDSVPYAMPMAHPMANRLADYQDMRWTGETTQWNYDQFSAPSRPSFIAGRSGQLDLQGSYWLPAKRTPPLGGMPHHQPCWHQMNGAQFATAAPQPYCHPADMQMHQYYPHQPMVPLEFQHIPQHYATMGMEQCHVMIPGNQHSLGVQIAPETRFCPEPSTMSRDAPEKGNLEFLEHSFGNISTRDNSEFSPTPVGFGASSDIMPSIPSPTVLDISEVSPDGAIETQNMVSNHASGSSSPLATMPGIDNSVRESPVDVATTPTNTAELCEIPVPTQQLLGTASES